ncbi:hypothetical protein ACHWQZ_G000686 [Mnemiopsis leidyi]
MENVSDQELRRLLSAKGHSIGPITNTTRSIYQKLYTKLLEEEDRAIEVKLGSPIQSPKPDPADTPVLRNKLKRSPLTDDEKLSEATFSVPEEKKKKGIPTYVAPSLRRSTIERTALSKKLAEEAGETNPKKSSLRVPGVRVTETSASLKTKIDAAEKAETKQTRGLSNTNKLNVTMGSTPGYMRATSSTLKKDSKKDAGSKKTDMNSTRTRMRRSIRLAARRSIRRAGQPTPVTKRDKDYIPKVGGSAIRKAKDTPSAAPKSKGGPAASGKKKRAPWDVKGRLEDVTNLYSALKVEKEDMEEKMTDLEADVEQKTEDLEILKIENDKLKSDLTSTTEQLSEVNMKCHEQQFKLDEAVVERNEKVASYERVKRERDELEEDFSRTKSKMREAENRADDLERDLRRANNAREEVEENLAKSKKHVGELDDKIEELKQDIEKLNTTIANKDSKICEIERILEKERGEKGDVHNVLRRKEEHIEHLDSKIASLEKTIKDLNETVAEKNNKIDSLEGNLSKEQRNHRDINRVLSDRESQICDLDQKLAVCTERLLAGEKLRRKLHNTIQELKGNIRVYCRVRPFLSSEVITGQPTHEIPQMDFGKDNSNITISSLQGEKLGRKGELLNNSFNFDHVFGPRHTQEDTFAEVSGLVQSALDGYNVCIFAYGQTGSGKTHTMQGPIDPTSEYRGIIPRAMEQVFKTGEEMADQGWNYVFTASFLEIYNENLHDLISSSDSKIEIKLVNEKSREVEVTNVKSIIVQNCYDVHELLLKANKNRTVAATKCNERSSRSHSVFRLKIEGKNTKNGDTCVGNLNLVDLAGSERVAHSGSTGQRLKEAQAINTSLSELGNVMMALQEKKTHIPYRNSKLTYLLCNSLGGNSKTLMFVNVSPLDKHTNESINSLRFASKVNKVDLGTAKKNK